MTPNFSSRSQWAASVLLGVVVSSGLCGLRPAFAQEEHLIWPGEIEQVIEDLNSPNRQTRRDARSNLPRLPRATLQRVFPELLSSPHRGTRLAAAALSWTVPTQDTAERLTAWLGDSDPDFRLAAATHFNASPDSSALAGLVRALRDSERRIQVAAATALGTLGDRDAVPALVAALRNRQGEVRQAAATALGWLADPSAMAALLELTTDEVPAVRVAALRSLGFLRDRTAVARAVSALQDRNGDVQQAAATALGAMGDPAVVPVLERALNNSESSAMAEVVVAALVTVGTPEALGAIVQQLDGESGHRELAIAALRRGGPDSVAPLKLCLQSRLAASIRSGCLRALPDTANADLAGLVEISLKTGQSTPVDGLTALGRVGTTSNLPAVLQWADSSDRLARRASLVSTRSLLVRGGGWGPAVDPIENALLVGTGINEQLLLIQLLGLTRSPRAQATLLQYVSSTNWRVQQVALEALALLPAPINSAIVVAQLDSVHPEVAWQAASTLRRVGGEGALRMLLPRVDNWNCPDIPLTRLALSGPFARFAKASQRQRLREQLRSARGAARSTLLEALGLSSSPDTESLLAAAAHDPAASARAKVAEILAFGRSQGVVSLRHLLDDSNAAVRANAAWALGQVGSAADWSALARHFDDRSWPVAANAAAAAAKLLVNPEPSDSAPLSNELESLCSLVDSPVPHAAANALIGLRRLGARCAEPNASWLIGHSRSSTLRQAAANYLASLPPNSSPAKRRHLFRLCKERDLDGSVAQTCAMHLEQLEHAGAEQPSPRHPPRSSVPPTKTSGLAIHGATTTPRVFVFLHEHEQAAAHPFALRLPDGWIRNGWTDERGAVLVEEQFDVGSPSPQPVVLAPVFLDGS